MNMKHKLFDPLFPSPQKNISVEKPVRGIVSDNRRPLARPQRLELNDLDTDNFTATCFKDATNTILQIQAQKMNELFFGDAQLTRKDNEYCIRNKIQLRGRYDEIVAAILLSGYAIARTLHMREQTFYRWFKRMFGKALKEVRGKRRRGKK
jgi:AraC-like DNA-binding protein